MTDHTDRVDVRDDAGNVIWVRRKMGWGIRNRVTSAAASIATSGGEARPDFDIGAYRNALLLVNILAWSGPDLDGKPITQDTIDDLDPVLGEAVYDKIGELNPTQRATQKKDSTNGIAAGSPATRPVSRARSTSR